MSGACAARRLVCLCALVIAVGACARSPASHTPTPAAMASPPAPVTSTAPPPAQGTPSIAVSPAGAATVVVTLIVETFPTPRATGTASPPREVSRFTSELYPYSVEYPADWQARAGGLSAGSLGGDVFTPTANGRAASINVLSEELSAGDELDVQEYVDLTVQQIEELQGDVVERVGDATVGGYPAVLVRWTDLSRPLQTTTITQAVWVAEGRGWVMTLAAPEELHDRHLPVLEHMLESWRPVA